MIDVFLRLLMERGVWLHVVQEQTLLVRTPDTLLELLFRLDRTISMKIVPSSREEWQRQRPSQLAHFLLAQRRALIVRHLCKLCIDSR